MQLENCLLWPTTVFFTMTSCYAVPTIYGLEITKEVKIPEVKEIHIKLPTAEPKKTLLPKPEKTEFVF